MSESTEMTDDMIRGSLCVLRGHVRELQNKLELVELQITQVQRDCPHRRRKSWTNNDGSGQFIVERCEVCGLQRDGGLG